MAAPPAKKRQCCCALLAARRHRLPRRRRRRTEAVRRRWRGGHGLVVRPVASRRRGTLGGGARALVGPAPIVHALDVAALFDDDAAAGAGEVDGDGGTAGEAVGGKGGPPTPDGLSRETQHVFFLNREMLPLS